MSGEGAAEEVDDERAAFIADVRRYKRLLRDRLQSLRDLQEEFEKLGYQNEIAVLGAGIDGTHQVPERIRDRRQRCVKRR